LGQWIAPPGRYKPVPAAPREIRVPVQARRKIFPKNGRKTTVFVNISLNMETKYPSPDGCYYFRIYPWEARMSLWIECPDLIEAGSGQSLFRFGDSNWSLDHAEWLDYTTAELKLRKYPGNHSPSSLTATIDCVQQTASLMGAPAIPLRELESAMDAALSRV
jgi:hypothetical protein